MVTRLVSRLKDVARALTMSSRLIELKNSIKQCYKTSVKSEIAETMTISTERIGDILHKEALRKMPRFLTFEQILKTKTVSCEIITIYTSG